MKNVRRTFVIRNGECVEVTRERESDAAAPFVHQDSFKNGLKHPKTGEMVYCHTRWNELNREHGLRVVGNDWKEQGPRNDVRDRVSEDRILDAIEKGISIETDPDKRSQKRYQEERELERYYGRRHDVIRNIVEIRELSRR